MLNLKLAEGGPIEIFSPISLKYKIIIITLYFKVLLYNLQIVKGHPIHKNTGK